MSIIILQRRSELCARQAAGDEEGRAVRLGFARRFNRACQLFRRQISVRRIAAKLHDEFEQFINRRGCSNQNHRN